MARKKWYAVIVGRAVGVFASWLQVAPLVIGVSGAQHQSFPTQEEAAQAFRAEIIRGTVKSIGDPPRAEDDFTYHSYASTSPTIETPQM